MYVFKSEIENERRNLLKTIEEENTNFTSNKVLKQSRTFERLLLKYVFTLSRINRRKR